MYTRSSLSSGTMPWETRDKYRWMSHGHYIRVVTCRELADAVQRDGYDRRRCLRYGVRQQQEARQEWGRYVITCSTLNASTISSNTSSLRTTTYLCPQHFSEGEFGYFGAAAEKSNGTSEGSGNERAWGSIMYHLYRLIGWEFSAVLWKLIYLTRF